jgi:sterol desaturase/sphingolipid hydroxylase (fatty acid hydroxylase superfamily)
MALSAILLGLINIAIVIALFLMIGAIIEWVMDWLGFSVPANVRKAFLALVALIALYMLVALAFGIPSIHIIAHGRPLLPA